MIKSEPRIETVDEVRVATSTMRSCPSLRATIAVRRRQQVGVCSERRWVFKTRSGWLGSQGTVAVIARGRIRKESR